MLKAVSNNYQERAERLIPARRQPRELSLHEVGRELAPVGRGWCIRACVTLSAPLEWVGSGWLSGRDKTEGGEASRTGPSLGPGGQDNAGLGASCFARGVTAEAMVVAPALSAK